MFWITASIIAIILSLALSLKIYSKFFQKNSQNTPKNLITDSDSDIDTNTELNPLNDPSFRSYLKAYTNLVQEENRHLLAEFLLDPEKAKILEWLCFKSHYMVPNSVLDQSQSVCHLSTISETSHCQPDLKGKCLCPHSLNEKTLSRTSSDSQLERDHSTLNSQKLSRSNSLNSLNSLDQKSFLTKMIQNQNLLMKVLPESNDNQHILIGTVGDQVIYLNRSQINLFDYLISQGILQHLKKNWESIQKLSDL